MNEEYWKKKSIEAQEHNEVTYIRFGAHGAQGSTSWVKGQNLKPWQRKKLEELLSDGTSEEDDFSDMC